MNIFTIWLLIWASDKLIPLGRSQDVDEEYIGCYEDGPTQDTRIFAEFGKYLPHWDPSECRRLCLKFDLFYYGISHRCMCFCGNSSSNYTQYGKREESECTEKCTSSTRRIKVYEVKCPDLEQLKNGDIQSSHRTARFTCDSGFEMVGQAELNCNLQNGIVRWNGQQPVCESVTTTYGMTNTMKPSTKVSSTATVSSTVRTYLFQSSSTPTIENGFKETTVETTVTKFDTTHSPSSVMNISLTSAEVSTEDNPIGTVLNTSASPLSTNKSPNTSSTGNTDSNNSVKEDILQLFFHLLIAILPVIVIFFFILLSCCCSMDDDKYRKRRSRGDTTCGPSSFEFMTPRVIKRQFSASTLPMTYNRSFGMYNSKPDLDCGNEIDLDETQCEDDHIYYDLAAESGDNQYEENGIIYV